MHDDALTQSVRKEFFEIVEANGIKREDLYKPFWLIIDTYHIGKVEVEQIDSIKFRYESSDRIGPGQRQCNVIAFINIEGQEDLYLYKDKMPCPRSLAEKGESPSGISYYLMPERTWAT